MQRRLEERLDEALARHRVVVEQRQHAALALDRPDRRRVLRPLDLALVVRRGRERAELRRPARADVRGQVLAGAVQQRQVLRRVHRDPVERRARLRDRVAGLEHVADHQRDREAVADVAAAAERQRDREAGVVDPVEQAPEAVAHADHAPPAPARQVDDPLQPLRGIVVVAHQRRAAGARPSALRAADDEARRAVEREQPGSQLVAPGKLDEPLVDRHELRHVALERAPAGRQAGPLGAVALEVPGAVRRPHRLEAAAPLLTRQELLDRLEVDPLRGGRRGLPARMRRQQSDVVAERLPDGLPVAVDRGGRLGGQPERLDPVRQPAQVRLVAHPSRRSM